MSYYFLFFDAIFFVVSILIDLTFCFKNYFQIFNSCIEFIAFFQVHFYSFAKIYAYYVFKFKDCFELYVCLGPD